MPTNPRKKVNCYTCLGSGTVEDKQCPTCRGQGFLLVPQSFPILPDGRLPTRSSHAL